MLYKAEVMLNKRVKENFVFTNLSHPNQVVRNVIDRVKHKYNYFVIVIINDLGDYWKFSVRILNKDKIVVRKITKSTSAFNKDEIDMILSSNVNILESKGLI